MSNPEIWIAEVRWSDFNVNDERKEYHEFLGVFTDRSKAERFTKEHKETHLIDSPEYCVSQCYRLTDECSIHRFP